MLVIAALGLDQRKDRLDSQISEKRSEKNANWLVIETGTRQIKQFTLSRYTHCWMIRFHQKAFLLSRGNLLFLSISLRRYSQSTSSPVYGADYTNIGPLKFSDSPADVYNRCIDWELDTGAGGWNQVWNMAN